MPRRNAAPTEILRYDKQGVFFEIHDDFLAEGHKFRFNFVQYDKKSQKRMGQVEFYVDEEDALWLAEIILNGDFAVKEKYIRQQMKANNKGSFDFPLLPEPQEFGKMGGKLGAHESGADLSRKLEMYVGNPGQIMIQGSEGKGKKNAQGLIVPQGRPDVRIQFYLSQFQLKQMASVLKARVHARYSAEYVFRLGETLKAKAQEEKEEREKYRKAGA